jgi:hypothetical protein
VHHVLVGSCDPRHDDNVRMDVVVTRLVERSLE